MAATEAPVRTAGLAVPFDPCELAGDPESWSERTQVFGSTFRIQIGGQEYEGVFITPEWWQDYQELARANRPRPEGQRGG